MWYKHFDRINTETGTVFSAVDDSLGNTLNEMLERLWDQDEIGSDILDESPLTEGERMVEEHFICIHTRGETGRFIVSIPFKSDINSIGSSRQIALHRFLSTERKMNSSPELSEIILRRIVA